MQNSWRDVTEGKKDFKKVC